MWPTFKIIYLLTLCLACGHGDNCDCGRSSFWSSMSTRVFGGVQVQSFEFPWMAHLRFFDGVNSTRYGLCGGYLIDHRHILTAAHCVHDMSKKLRNIKAIEVYLGLTDLKKLNKPHRVKAFFFPKNYDQESLYNDIAILRLQKQVKFSERISPICLTKSTIEPNEILTVIGYGRLGPNKKPAQALMRVNVEYIENNQCNKMLRDFIIRANPDVKKQLHKYKMPKVHSSHMCAVDTYEGGDACSGDSGGPLMYRNDQNDRYYAVGIVSGAMDECGDSRTPGFYTIVKQFKSFIKRIAPDASFCSLYN